MSQTGVLLVNLGSPRSPAPDDVRRFLRELLMDPHVLDMPWLARLCLVRFLILPLRTAKAAAAYRKIWTDEGSPLVATGLKLAAALQHELGRPVAIAMRYGEPSIPDALHTFSAHGVRRLLLVPMFPQYALSTYEAAVAGVKLHLASIAPGTELIVHPPFYAAHEYITALATVTKTHLPKDFDHLLFSFHSLPERHLRKADPTRAHCLVKPDCCHAPSPAHATCYKHQCLKTMEAVVETLGLPPSKCSIAFQSQFGLSRWLGPGTMAELRRLAMAGAKKVAVICPSFVADCVETLEEIGMRARAEFMAAGGREFVLIPCLNDHVSWVRALAVMITQAVNQRTAT